MASSLWAVTCLFNPQRSRRRVFNFRQFRRALKLPLLAVELSFNGEFDLEPGDADILVRLRGPDVMWQKERLLNLGVSRLPRDCDSVALLDCDIVFTNPKWDDEALEALRDCVALQPFAQALSLDAPSSERWTEGRELRGAMQHSLASLIHDGHSPFELLGPQKGRNGQGTATPGFAWVYRRDLLDRHGLFEACVVGGGDAANAAALWGAFAAAEKLHVMNEAQQRFYRAWGQPFYDDARGQTGFVRGRLLHLWHGHFADRRTASRHQYLAPHCFDPASDLGSGPVEPLHWASDKPGLHLYVRNYVAALEDDGPRPIRGVLILRHPWLATDFYNCVTDWIREYAPETIHLFSVRELPVEIEDADVVKAVVMWLQEPLENWSPGLYVMAEALATYYESRGVPVINRPGITSRASKSSAAPLIASAGFRVPRMELIEDPSAFRRDFGGLPFPFFVRENRFHQSAMLPASSPEEAEALPLESFSSPVAVERIDVADPVDGLFRKFRYFACGEIGVSQHLQISRNWIVRGAGRENTAQARAEELEYIGRPDPHHDRFQRAMRALRLDMAAFDYSYDRHGEVVVWEVNPFPYIRLGVTTTTHRNRAIHRSIAAMVAMYLGRAGLEVPEAVQSWLAY